MVTADDVRRIALALPRTEEHLIRNRLKYRIGRIVYAALSEDETTLGFAFPKEERDALVAAEPDKFCPPARSDERYNWVQVRLAALDEQELRELVVEAWRMVVPKRVAAAYADPAARPVLLGPNQPSGRPYRGGPGIARLRGLPGTRTDVPEDFLASTTETAAGNGSGLTVLADGRTLRDHIAHAPEAFLGPRHVTAFGPEPALLVKLLDTAERLFVHFHPDDAFAARHLDCRWGKTEAWYIVDTDSSAADRAGEVYLGFRRDVSADEVGSWVERQDVDALLGALNRIPARPGDSFFVPAGVPHAIGAGITIVELQQPTDFSILLEWTGYGIAAGDRQLGLEPGTALAALDRSGRDPATLAAPAGGGRPTGRPGVTRLFPPAADRFFRAEHLAPTEPVVLPPEFSVLVVLDGTGELASATDRLALRRGSVALLPYAAGPVRLTGTLRAVRCLPPEPGSPPPDRE